MKFCAVIQGMWCTCLSYTGLVVCQYVIWQSLPGTTLLSPGLSCAASVVKAGVIYMGGQETAKLALAQKAPTAEGKNEDFNPRAAIFRVRWSGGEAAPDRSVWVASGGQTGLVRSQRVML